MGNGAIFSSPTKRIINTKRSTEADLVGVHNMMPQIICTKEFLKAQGFDVIDNIVHQDNQSAMELEQNGRLSSRKRNRNIDIR